jgi:hypothetical protein
LRFHRVHDFIIAYAPDEMPLLVVGVIHGRRNPRVIAALLRGRQQSFKKTKGPQTWGPFVTFKV